MLISDFPCDLSISFGEVSKGFVCFPGKTEPPSPPMECGYASISSSFFYPVGYFGHVCTST